jgi:hypothetical protein
MGENVAHDKNVYKIMVGKLEGKRPLRRYRHRWEGAIEMRLKKENTVGEYELDSSGSE